MFESFKEMFKGGREKQEEPKKEGQANMEMKPDSGSNYETAKKIEKEWEERKKQDPNAWREQK